MATDLASRGGLTEHAELNGISAASPTVVPNTSNGVTSASSSASNSSTNSHSLFERNTPFIQSNDQGASPETSVEEELKEETTPEESSDLSGSPLTLRALVTTKEAGVIIGKAGKNVAELRETTSVKAGVTKVVQGVQDRVLSVAGTLEGVSKV